MKYNFTITTSFGDKDRAINEIEYAFNIRNITCMSTEHYNDKSNLYSLQFDVDGNMDIISDVLEIISG